MKRYRIIPCFLLTIFLFIPACAVFPAKAQEIHSDLARDLSPQVTDADLASLVGGNSDFAFSLYHQIAESDKNVIYSPYSISLALAMTYAGANGETSTQMEQALNFTLPEDRLHKAFNRLALELASRSKVEGLKPDQVFQLNVANSLWGQKGFSFEQAYLDLLAQNYAAGMRLVDYQKDSEAAREVINDWVAQSTNQKIKDIIPPGVLNALTRLVLADAVYFKATWQKSFDIHITQPDTFHLPDGGSVSVDMMNQLTGLEAMQGDGYRAVEMAYAGGQLSMLVLLPDEGRFTDVETRLNAGLVAETVAALQPMEVYLTMPKFKMEWSSELSKGLSALGMIDAFNPALADFSGIDGARDLYISPILHKAFVSVDEVGTEAAAATVIVEHATCPGCSSPAEPFRFKADRPFFFFIRDNPTGTILFVGRVMNPAVS